MAAARSRLSLPAMVMRCFLDTPYRPGHITCHEEDTPGALFNRVAAFRLPCRQRDSFLCLQHGRVGGGQGGSAREGGTPDLCLHGPRVNVTRLQSCRSGRS